MKYRVLEHARMRYNTMNPRERFLRVGKMAQLEKLEAFLWVARENGDESLAQLVTARISQINNFNRGIVSGPTVRNVGKAAVIDRQEPRREDVKSRTPKVKDGKGDEAVVELERDIVL